MIAVAVEDRKAGILGEARIAEGKIAEDEGGLTVGFDAAGMNTISAEASGDGPIRTFFLIHGSSIAQ